MIINIRKNYLNLFINLININSSIMAQQNIGIIIVEKTGTLKSLIIKEYVEDELYKKCGFKNNNNFAKQTEWKVKMEGKKYLVSVYAKTDGKANTENKYDFPPPIDTKLFFGNCSIVATMMKEDKTYELTSLSITLWIKMYEKLFGGFEDLASTALDDELEIDELANVPQKKKTKDGYLKDGFVVDSEGDDAGDDDYDSADGDDDDDGEDDDEDDDSDENGDLDVEDIGSELSSEEFETDTDDEDNDDNDDNDEPNV
jgi:hypothetical protein